MGIPEKFSLAFDLAKKAMNLELQEAIMNLREDVFTVREENLDLKKKLSELEEALAVKESLVFDIGVYWKAFPDGNRDSTPFCPRCFNVDNKSVRLRNFTSIWSCPHCEKSFDK